MSSFCTRSGGWCWRCHLADNIERLVKGVTKALRCSGRAAEMGDIDQPLRWPFIDASRVNENLCKQFHLDGAAQHHAESYGVKVYEGSLGSPLDRGMGQVEGLANKVIAHDVALMMAPVLGKTESETVP